MCSKTVSSPTSVPLHPGTLPCPRAKRWRGNPQRHISSWPCAMLTPLMKMLRLCLTSVAFCGQILILARGSAAPLASPAASLNDVFTSQVRSFVPFFLFVCCSMPAHCRRRWAAVLSRDLLDLVLLLPLRQVNPEGKTLKWLLKV